MNAAARDLQTLFEVGSFGGLSDGQLLGRFVERQEEAVFEAIVHRHGPMVWGVCRRVLRDHHDAEDAFQATFLVLARKASSIMPREKLGNWLYGVAYQTAMKARAMRAKRRARESRAQDISEPQAVSHDLRDDLTDLLDGELIRLPEKYRIPIVLCDLEGRTHQEVASQLGWPIGTVSSRLSRARAMLAKRLSRQGLSLSVGSLAVLLAQESASASMPNRLIGPTARAASLLSAGGELTAGAVSVGVAALTGEVMKLMLLSKIQIAMSVLLVGIVLTIVGTGLADQAKNRREKPARRRAQDIGAATNKSSMIRLTSRPMAEDGIKSARRDGDVSAPVVYQDLMLVLTTSEGAAAVVFTDPTERGVKYRFRYESNDGMEAISGTGALFEKRENGRFAGGRLFVQAGPIRLGWSAGGVTRGWIYYNPERLRVQIANADDFEDRDEARSGGRPRRLSLKRFIR